MRAVELLNPVKRLLETWRLCGRVTGHWYGQWQKRGHGGYERRNCRICGNMDLRRSGD